MHGALASQLPELAVLAPGAELLAVVLFQPQKARFAHPALVVVLVYRGVVSFLSWSLFSVIDQRSR